MSEVDARTKLKLALVGCGRISQSHLDAIQYHGDKVTLTHVCDSNHDAAKAVTEKYGGTAFSQYEEMIAGDGFDAVLIASPNFLHFDQALTAIRAGKHVLVEKPLTETVDEAGILAEEAKNKGLVLAAAHTFRHGQATYELLKHFPSFGKLLSVQVSQCVHWDGPQAPWWAERTPEQNLILSMFAPHPLDFIQLVMGDDDPVRVYAEGARHQSGWQGEDEAMIILTYPQRRMVSLHISYNQPYLTDRKMLYFDKGVAEIRNGEWLTWNGEELYSPPAGRVTDPHSMGGHDLSGFFNNQMDEFVKAVKGEMSYCPTGLDAARLIRTLNRVRKSVRANSVDAIDGPLPC
ncbi:Gfo/Idh/MocA family oxidoreductase [Alteromonas sp. NFXS44]|uniref:Gfo/Idh/MocA family protein n=1 Tax=Alteromonas sp. NFXS44 TaxID=2818435 RepID=UPI0032DE6A60